MNARFSAALSVALISSLVFSTIVFPQKARAAFNGVLPVASLGTTPDAATVTLSDYDLRYGESATVTFTFPAAPASFTTSDITADNGVITNLAVTGDPKIYTATYTPTWYMTDTTNTISVSPRISVASYSIAGSGPYAISFDGTNMWATGGDDSSISKVTPLGASTTYTSTGLQPFSVAFDGTNMWTGNNAGSSVSKIAPNGSITTYANIGTNVYGIAFDGTNMWTANFSENSVSKVAPDGSKVKYSGTGGGPWGIAFDGTNMWTANYMGSSVTKIAANGTMTTYSLNGGSGPIGIAYGGGYIWTSNVGNSTVSKIASDGTSTSYSAPAGAFSLAYDGTNMWGATYAGRSLIKVAPDGSSIEYSMGSDLYPNSIAFDGTNMWTANIFSDNVSKITEMGAGTSSNFNVDTRSPTFVSTGTATNVSSGGATLHGEVTQTGGTPVTTRGFNYGTTTQYGSTISTTGSYEADTYELSLSGINCGKTYYYRSFAINAIGTGYGIDQSFTTNTCGVARLISVVPQASGAVPLDFSIIGTTKNSDGSQQVNIRLNADIGTVSGYIASFDPTLSDTVIKPYPVDGIGGVDVKGNNGGTIYVKYVSTTGNQSETISHSFGKNIVTKTSEKIIKGALGRSLALGMTGDDVATVQACLEKGGFLTMPKGASYGTFGPRTKTAIGKFQIKNKILASAKGAGYGKVGPLTIGALTKACGL